jgi:hypothetical protein
VAHTLVGGFSYDSYAVRAFEETAAFIGAQHDVMREPPLMHFMASGLHGDGAGAHTGESAISFMTVVVYPRGLPKFKPRTSSTCVVNTRNFITNINVAKSCEIAVARTGRGGRGTTRSHPASPSRSRPFSAAEGVALSPPFDPCSTTDTVSLPARRRGSN